MKVLLLYLSFINQYGTNISCPKETISNLDGVTIDCYTANTRTNQTIRSA